MSKMWKKLGVLVLIGVLTFTVLGGCAAVDQPETKGTVKIGYVNWAEGIAMTNLAMAILEDEMGYGVEKTMAEPAMVFTSVANGNNDVFLDAWLPVTHESYMERYGDDLVDLGLNFDGARIGLAVPAYVDIDSIEEMNEVKDKFQGRIIGIDAGAGIMGATERAIEDYDLDFDLVPGSGPTMTAALKNAIDRDEWAVVTGWQPHWKFARWDLKFLDDPQGIYGAVEKIHTVARTGIEEDMPEVAEFFKNFFLDDQELGSLMGMIAESDEDPIVEARNWIEQNRELVESWIPAQ